MVWPGTTSSGANGAYPPASAFDTPALTPDPSPASGRGELAAGVYGGATLPGIDAILAPWSPPPSASTRN
ncbi:hypothetical protein CBM2587_A20079 [Cupriavidus taiwanensis]|uniref:Uncharacterized protein n=1 Tax=Cupriavidus taiwanensis TaxID=164546 RepID=A0A375BPM4_9BURK|nr:hypothetical protein CBM2587_A20079 [Cupriavidus taiwanensis]